MLIELYSSIAGMSFKTYTARNNNKAKKGISPVIATVILVAVAVVIAAALAGFSSSLFGTYSSAGASVSATSVSISAATNKVDYTLENSGNTADKLVSIQANNNAPVTQFTGTTPSDGFTLNANGGTAAGQTTSTVGTFNQGDIVTVKLTMKSGAVLSQSVIVGP
jgi:flagellin-like protein